MGDLKLGMGDGKDLGGGGRGENMIVISCMENIFQLKKS